MLASSIRSTSDSEASGLSARVETRPRSRSARRRSCLQQVSGATPIARQISASDERLLDFSSLLCFIYKRRCPMEKLPNSMGLRSWSLRSCVL